jgi:hypothetical protein
MFDTLTLDDLYEFHHQLCMEHLAVHTKMMDGFTPRIPVLSEEWGVLMAKCAEISETVHAVSAEISRRETVTRADA